LTIDIDSVKDDPQTEYSPSSIKSTPALKAAQHENTYFPPQAKSSVAARR
jgi:hypothetical protein